MRRLVVYVNLFLFLPSLAFAQLVVRPRIGSVSAGATPQIQITSPSQTGASSQSATNTTLSGACIVTGGCDSVTWTLSCSGACPGATSGTATLTGGLTWTFSGASCPGGASTATYTVTGHKGAAATSPAPTHVVTCLQPDTTAPTIANVVCTDVSAPGVDACAGGGAASTTQSTQTFSGQVSDDVAVTRVRITCSPTCLQSDFDAQLTADGHGFTASVSYTAAGNHQVYIYVYDQAGNVGGGPTTQGDWLVTSTIPLTIQTELTLPNCRETEAYFGTSGYSFVAVGGSGAPYTWSKTAGSYPTPANPAFALSAGGVLTGTPSATAAGTYSITIQVQDSGAAHTASATFSLTCVTAAAETKHTYYEYQINKAGTGQSGRPMCASDGTGTNCIIEFSKCLNSVYGEKGACSFRNQLQLGALGSGNATATGNPLAYNQFNYVFGNDQRPDGTGAYNDPQDAARVVFSGVAAALCNGTRGVGCSNLSPAEKLASTFPDQYGAGNTLTFVIDYWLGPEFKSNGVQTVSNCGGLLGDTKRFKHMRINTRAGTLMSWPSKFDVEQPNQDRWFKTSATDRGIWDCSDNVVAMQSTGATGGGVFQSTADSLVTPDAIGVQDPDTAIEPAGKGSAVWDSGGGTSDNQTYPVFASTWTRIILYYEFSVPANSSKLNDWRAGCDPRGPDFRIETNSVNAGADTTISTGTFNHGLQVGDTVLVWGNQGSVPGINGLQTVTAVDSPTTFRIGVDVTTAGHDGVVVKQVTTSQDTKCANMLTTIGAIDSDCLVVDAANCDSHWNLISAWVIDENHGAQRLSWRWPWHTYEGTKQHKLYEIETHLDGPSSGCGGCGDRFYYQRNMFIIHNINTSGGSGIGGDLDDTGCPDACLGDVGVSPNNNLFRKPKR